MDATTRESCEQLTAIITEYSDCGSYGKVIKNPSLLVPANRFQPRAGPSRLTGITISIL